VPLGRDPRPAYWDRQARRIIPIAGFFSVGGSPAKLT
jgi:hypothetical protein